MSIVNPAVSYESCREFLGALAGDCPCARLRSLGCTPFRRQVLALSMGFGERSVLFSAAHHANEWITALVLLEFARDCARALKENDTLLGVSAKALAEVCTIHLVPLVNPDGVDLVTGAVAPDSPQYAHARKIAAHYPEIPFPEGWKANLLGTDLNLNYPAGWRQARKNKALLGVTAPAPRDYVGSSPLNQSETRALAAFTREVQPEVVVALHSQGQEIYWQYGGLEIPGARELGEALAQVSGYALADTPYLSAFAGYKDWFIKTFRRPGYTVEVGLGENPLPLAQFPEIYRSCLPLLLTAALGKIPVDKWGEGV